ncbi:hypothetical protein UlMin_019613 [Ulmus minor]
MTTKLSSSLTNRNTSIESWKDNDRCNRCLSGSSDGAYNIFYYLLPQMLYEISMHEDEQYPPTWVCIVIEYVQFLQEKVTKYEGSFAWMFRNSHWRVQSLNGHSQSVKTNGPGSAFPGKFDENYIPINPTMLASMHNPVEFGPSKALDHQQGITLPMPLPGTMSATNRSDGALGHSLQRPVSDAQTNQCPITNNALNQRNELSVEGGTISMSIAYAQGLLNTLAQALQSAVQIDLGKRANRVPSSKTSISKGGDVWRRFWDIGLLIGSREAGPHYSLLEKKRKES